MKLDVLKRLKGHGAKSLLLTGAMVLILCLALGMSFAYLSQTFEESVNQFGTATIDFEVKETFVNNSKSGIKVSVPATSNGHPTIDVYARVNVVCNWKDTDGNVVAKFDDLNVLPTDLGDNWVLGADGYYYYTKVITPGTETTELFKSAISGEPDADGNILNVTVLAEVIQASGADGEASVVVTAWEAVTAGGNGADLVVQTN